MHTEQAIKEVKTEFLLFIFLFLEKFKNILPIIGFILYNIF